MKQATPKQVREHINKLVKIIKSVEGYTPLEQRTSGPQCALKTQDFGYSGNTPLSLDDG